MNKTGFTLSEVLVTLGILGVVAVATLPLLKNAQPNQELMMFKKAYYLAERNIGELVNDDGLYPEPDEINGPEYLANTIATVFKGHQAEGSSKFCVFFAAKMNTIGDVNCANNTSLDNGGNFRTTDGIVWSVPVTRFPNVNHAYAIFVDVNNKQNSNNCFYHPQDDCGAPDRFIIWFYPDGRVMVKGRAEQAYLNATKPSSKTVVENNKSINEMISKQADGNGSIKNDAIYYNVYAISGKNW